MTFKVYAIRDEKTEFLSPTLDFSDATALRNFNLGLSRSDTVMGANKSDFCLYEVGLFDTESGLLTATIPPRFVARGGEA